MIRKLISTCIGAIALLASGVASAQTPSFKIAVLKFGTVNWELSTMAEAGLDAKHGFKLDVQDVAGEPAAKIAFQGGAADAIVSDWIWVARQRAAGKDYVFIPYSKAVGGLMVPADSKVKSLEDLKGGTIGVAGGSLDKSWLLIQALAKKRHNIDLATEAEPVFGAPPLIYKKALQGELTGAINFWHFLAKMEAGGMRELVSVAEAAEALGLSTETPLLGYVVKGEFIRENPQLAASFAAASQDTKALLATDDAAWEKLRPKMNADNDAQFQALKAGFRKGIPASGPIDKEAAGRLLAVMAELGGEELVGEAKTLPDGVFFSPGS